MFRIFGYFSRFTRFKLKVMYIFSEYFLGPLADFSVQLGNIYIFFNVYFYSVSFIIIVGIEYAWLSVENRLLGQKQAIVFLNVGIHTITAFVCCSICSRRLNT